jgi:hypothetical protein
MGSTVNDIARSGWTSAFPAVELDTSSSLSFATEIKFQPPYQSWLLLF